MLGADAEVVARLTLDETGAVTGAQAAARATRTVGTAAGASTAQVGLLARSLNALKANALIAGLAAIYAAFRSIGASVKDAGVQQIAERKLEQALRNTGEAGGKAADDLKRLASETQNVSNFGDEAIITAQAMLLSFGEVGGAKGAGMLTGSLVDMAAGLQKASGETQDLNQIAASLGKALTGGVGVLKRYGISLTDAQEAAFASAEGLEKVALLAEVVRSNFGGMAAATVDPMVQLKNAMSDLSEQAGGPLRDALAQASVRLTVLAQDPGVIALVRGIGAAFGWLVNATIRSFDAISSTVQTALAISKRGVASMAEGIAGALGTLERFLSGVASVAARLGPLGNALESVSAGAAAAVRRQREETERYAASKRKASEAILANVASQRQSRAAMAAVLPSITAVTDATEALGTTATSTAAAIAPTGSGSGSGSLAKAAKDMKDALEQAREESEKLEAQLAALRDLSPSEVRALAAVTRELARQRAEMEMLERVAAARAGVGPDTLGVQGRGPRDRVEGGDAIARAYDDAEKLKESLGDVEGVAVDVSASSLSRISALVANVGGVLSETLGGVGALFRQMGQESETAFAVYKGIAIAQAIADTYRAANVALASAPPPFNFALAAGVTAAGLANVLAIKNSSRSGAGSSSRGGSPTRRTVPSGAASVPAGLALGYGSGGTSGAGRAPTVNVAAPPAPTIVVRNEITPEGLATTVEYGRQRIASGRGRTGGLQP